MAKRFNIHEWQAKQRLTEQRADWKAPKIGMSPGEIDNDLDLLISLRNQIEQGTLDSKMRDKFVELLDDLIDKEDENNDMNLAQDDVNDFNSERDLEEMNSLASAGSGASVTTGDGMGYMSPKIFGNDKKKKMKVYKSLGYKKI
jgi:hypothetical protein